jgi:hypothetical protein
MLRQYELVLNFLGSTRRDGRKVRESRIRCVLSSINTVGRGRPVGVEPDDKKAVGHAPHELQPGESSCTQECR